MVELTSARNRCKDANRIVLDLTYQYSELFVLAGCYGRVVRTKPLYEKKMSNLETLKQSLSQSRRLIESQVHTCNQFSARSADSPTAKRLSFIQEEDLSNEHYMIIEALMNKTQSLLQ